MEFLTLIDTKGRTSSLGYYPATFIKEISPDLEEPFIRIIGVLEHGTDLDLAANVNAFRKLADLAELADKRKRDNR